MQIETHENFAMMMSAYAGEALPEQALMAGCIAPNRDMTWPKPHHLNRRASRVIIDAIRLARRDYLAGRNHDAAFHLGAASHYVLDAMVPDRAPSREHASYESRFAKIDRHADYGEQVKVSLADGRFAQHAVNQALRIAATKPISTDQRLEAAHLCLLRLTAAVIADREPMEIIDHLADAFVVLSTALEKEAGPTRESAQKALEANLPEDWDAGESDPEGDVRLTVGVYEVLDQYRKPVAWHTGLLARSCLQKFRGDLQAILDRYIPQRQSSADLERNCREAVHQYNHTVAAVRDRRSYWDWYDVQWEFWEEKGRLAHEWVIGEVRKAREGPVDVRVQRFREACAGELRQAWPGSLKDKLGVLCVRMPWLKWPLAVMPSLPVVGVLAALWAGGILPPIVAGATAILVAAACTFYMGTVLRDATFISHFVHTPIDEEEEAALKGTGGKAGGEVIFPAE